MQEPREPSHEILDVPDLRVREWADKVSDEEIESLRFTGGDIHADDDGGIVVTDRALISRFLEALRHATGREVLAGNRACFLFIRYRGDAADAEPDLCDPRVTLRFWPANAADCFGPEFQAALRTLSDYYAGQVGRQISEIVGLVTEIEVANHIEHITRVTAPEEIAALTQALTRLDGRAFAFTTAPNHSLWVRLHLGSKGMKDVNLVVAHSASAEPPLPTLLWHYYRRANQWRDDKEFGEN